MTYFKLVTKNEVIIFMARNHLTKEIMIKNGTLIRNNSILLFEGILFPVIFL